MSISTNLRREMISHDITTAQLSKLSGVSKANLNKYLDGRIKPAQNVLERIANALGCNADELNDDNIKVQRKNGNITIAYAAKQLGIPAQTLRIALQQGLYPFGVAIRMSGRYTYQITPSLFEQYIGGLKAT